MNEKICNLGIKHSQIPRNPFIQTLILLENFRNAINNHNKYK